MIDHKSKIFFLVFFLAIVSTVGVAYYRFIFAKNYSIEAQSECDPSKDACFVHVCDPEAEECTGDKTEDTSYYKVMNRLAKNIPLCDPNTAGCEAMICPQGEEGCEETLCSEDTWIEGDTCNDPEIYNASTQVNPDADTEAAEGDLSTADVTCETMNESGACTDQDTLPTDIISNSPESSAPQESTSTTATPEDTSLKQGIPFPATTVPDRIITPKEATQQ